MLLFPNSISELINLQFDSILMLNYRNYRNLFLNEHQFYWCWNSIRSNTSMYLFIYLQTEARLFDDLMTKISKELFICRVFEEKKFILNLIRLWKSSRKFYSSSYTERSKLVEFQMNKTIEIRTKFSRKKRFYKIL